MVHLSGWASQMPGTRCVAYYRVSTTRQGRSGLGLDAQREAIRLHLSASGGELLGAYTEVESGRRSHRSEPAKRFGLVVSAVVV